MIASKQRPDDFDKDEPVEFPLNRVIPGLDGRVCSWWARAARSRSGFPRDLAYGARGAGRDIGPNEALEFEVEADRRHSLTWSLLRPIRPQRPRSPRLLPQNSRTVKNESGCAHAPSGFFINRYLKKLRPSMISKAGVFRLGPFRTAGRRPVRAQRRRKAPRRWAACRASGPPRPPVWVADAMRGCRCTSGRCIRATRC